MSEEEYSYYLYNLNRHTEKVKTAFANLLFELQKHLEQTRSVRDVVLYLKMITRNGHFETSFSSMGEVFENLHTYSSFFNCELIKRLTRKFGSQKVKARLTKYRNMVEAYLKRRVIEFPNDVFEDSTISGEVYIIKTDHVFKDLTGEELCNIHYQMNRILKQKMVRLLRIEEGCTQLTFIGFAEDKFNITAEQQQTLRNLGVLSIRYGEYFINIEKEFPKHGKYTI